MKNRLAPLFALAALLGGAPAFADSETYRFDPVHTQILFCLDHLGFSTPCGRLHVKDGSFSFDPKDFGTAHVDVEIDLDSLSLGDAEWEKHVKSGDYLNVAKYPVARFTSSAVERTGAPIARNGVAHGPQTGVIHGELSLHGRTRKLDLPFTFRKLGVNPYNFKRMAGFSAALKFKRSDFGLERFLSVVGDELEVRIEVEGLRDRHAGEALKPEPDSTAPGDPHDSPAATKEPADATTQH